jgi:hypothetical protein
MRAFYAAWGEFNRRSFAVRPVLVSNCSKLRKQRTQALILQKSGNKGVLLTERIQKKKFLAERGGFELPLRIENT